jgi:hypothetical protein
MLCAQEFAMDDLQPFISFTNKANKLMDSTFAKDMIGRTGVDLSWEGDKQIVDHRGPGAEFVDAFILTFRFFIQKNESISFIKMSDSFKSKIVSENIKEQFIDAKKHLNNYLDSNTMFNIGGFISRRNLIDVFVYGELSHSNPAQKKTYDTWMSNEFMAPLLKYEFRLVIHNVLQIIAFVSGLSKQVVLSVKST